MNKVKSLFSKMKSVIFRSKYRGKLNILYNSDSKLICSSSYVGYVIAYIMNLSKTLITSFDNSKISVVVVYMITCLETVGLGIL